MDNVTEILVISFNNESGNYNVKIPSGSNLNEVFFGINVLIKCLVRDKIIDSEDVAIDTLKKYLTDPQYQELKDIPEETANDRDADDVVQ